MTSVPFFIWSNQVRGNKEVESSNIVEEEKKKKKRFVKSQNFYYMCPLKISKPRAPN